MGVRLRHEVKRLYAAFPLNWFLAILVAIDGYIFLQAGLLAVREARPESWENWLTVENLNLFLQTMGLIEIPRLMLGAGLQVMALGLILRARIAWVFSLLLLVLTSAFVLLHAEGHLGLAVYTVMLTVVLGAYWRRFNRSSLAAGSLFAVLSIVSLLIYAVFGALYLGNEFRPPIHDAATAFYFSIVSMSTVGYGDITPQTVDARLFTVSIIILGLTVLATSVSAIVGPIIGGNFKRLFQGHLSNVMRKDHIVIAGETPLAQSVYRGLRKRGYAVTVIVTANVPHEYPGDADLVVGDPSNSAVLKEAGAPNAEYVLALRDDDAENAFIVLAVKEVGGPKTKTVALANTNIHLDKMKRVAPDMVVSLQLLGGELLSRTLSGESCDSDLVAQLFFAKDADVAT